MCEHPAAGDRPRSAWPTISRIDGLLHRHARELGHVARARHVAGRVEAVRTLEVGVAEAELRARSFIIATKRSTSPSPDVVGERPGRRRWRSGSAPPRAARARSAARPAGGRSWTRRRAAAPAGAMTTSSASPGRASTSTVISFVMLAIGTRRGRGRGAALHPSCPFWTNDAPGARQRAVCAPSAPAPRAPAGSRESDRRSLHGPERSSVRRATMPVGRAIADVRRRRRRSTGRPARCAGGSIRGRRRGCAAASSGPPDEQDAASLREEGAGCVSGKHGAPPRSLPAGDAPRPRAAGARPRGRRRCASPRRCRGRRR